MELGWAREEREMACVWMGCLSFDKGVSFFKMEIAVRNCHGRSALNSLIECVLAVFTL